MPAINLSPLTAEQESLDRRRKMAEAMQQQAILPIEMPNVPGAKVSHLQGFAKLLQGYIAGKNLERAEEEKKQYEADTMGDYAKVIDLMGRTETVPGAVISPAVEPQPIPENIAQQAELERLSQPKALFEAKAAYGGNPILANAEQIKTLPTMTEAQAEERAPSQQIPALKASMLKDAKFTQTSEGRRMLAQALVQQQAQQQAEALRKREAEQAIVKFGPDDTAGRIVDGKFVPLVTGKPKIEYTKVEMRDPATGQPMIKYVDKTKLGELGNILAPYTGMIADLVQAQNLPAAIQNNPEALRLIGGFLGKQGGDVTAADFAKVMIGLDETNARLRNESIPPVTTDIVRPKNIMIQSKPLPPEGSPLENGQVYDTPKGQARWNGTKFVTIN
tara:strand:+ start:386 stop:1555 length:1170 start_codon:yes stop_codon:yes gene_type:complete